MAGILKSIYDWLLRLFWYVCPTDLPGMLQYGFSARVCRVSVCALAGRTDAVGLWLLTNIVDVSIRATEMDITMIGLQNAGKTSLLRVLAVGFAP